MTMIIHKWSKNFDERLRHWGWIFHGGMVVVISASQEQCSRLQQLR